MNGVKVSKMAVRPSVTIPAVVVPSPQQAWQVFSGTNVALFMWIFYPVVPLSTVNNTVVF